MTGMEPKIYKKIQLNPHFARKIYIFPPVLTYIYC